MDVTNTRYLMTRELDDNDTCICGVEYGGYDCSV